MPNFVAMREASGAEMQVASSGGGGGLEGETEGWAAAKTTSAAKMKLRILM